MPGRRDWRIEVEAGRGRIASSGDAGMVFKSQKLFVRRFLSAG